MCRGRYLKYEETKNPLYLQSEPRLIVRQNKKTGETDGFIMEITPDVNYLEKHKNKALEKMKYLNRDKKFTGCVLLHYIYCAYKYMFDNVADNFHFSNIKYNSSSSNPGAYNPHNKVYTVQNNQAIGTSSMPSYNYPIINDLYPTVLSNILSHFDCQ
jgi:hypothetical protein